MDSSKVNNRFTAAFYPAHCTLHLPHIKKQTRCIRLQTNSDYVSNQPGGNSAGRADTIRQYIIENGFEHQTWVEKTNPSASGHAPVFFFSSRKTSPFAHINKYKIWRRPVAPPRNRFLPVLYHTNTYIHTYTWYEGRVLRPVKFLVPYFELGKLISYICDSGIISSVIASKYENDIGLNKVSVRILKKMR